MATRYRILISRDVGIAQNNIVKVSASDVANGEYAKFTATGLEGRSYAEVASDINAVTSTEGLTIQTMTAAAWAALTPKPGNTVITIIVG